MLGGNGGKGAASTPAPESLPPSRAELAALYASTLTAAAFLAPKGVSCTIGRLAPTVRGLCGLELTGTHLRQMCGLDASLALRFAIVTSGDVELELVVRESLRMIATPGAVRSRHKRFVKALASTAGEVPQVAVPPLPAGITQQRQAIAEGAPDRSERTSIATASMSSPSRARSLTDVSGLPSPPPRPLRRASIAAPSPPNADARREGGLGTDATAVETAQGDVAASLATADDDVEGDWEDEVRPASAEEAACTAHSVDGSRAARTQEHVHFHGGGQSGGCSGGGVSSEPRPAPIAAGSGERPSACERFLRRLRHSPFLTDQIIHYHEQPARPAEYAMPRVELAPAVRALLEATGRTRLYSHQACAVEALMGGGHVMLCTPTASGKSLGYLIPTLHAMATDGNSRALFLFPTKALAQDQKRALRSLTNACATPLFGLPVATYDGDTPQAERAELRQSTRIFLSNPDMLHCSILPHHKEWAPFLSHLSYVVVDEAHMYGGIFGAHVALILRRLRRLARLYGSNPSFVCCSATVGNPAELFQMLTGVSRDATTVITGDGSPHGRRRLLFWNPPLAAQSTPLPPGKGVPLTEPQQAVWSHHWEGPPSEQPPRATASTAEQPPPKRRRGPAAPDEARDEPASGFSASGFSAAEEARRRAERMRRDDEGRRASSNIEAAVLLAEMVRAELKTICFCSVRKICELVLDYARQHLRAELGVQSPHAPSLLGAYRGGLTPADRRRVEAQLYDGTLRGVTATSSLELGVDIANLDGVIMLGFPGSLASLWQRAGRCGRTADSDALCVLVAYPSAIDQWVMRHPERTLAMGVEPAVVDIANPMVLEQHLLCAAKEQPLTAEDAALFGGLSDDGAVDYHQAVQRLQAEGKLIALPLPGAVVSASIGADADAAAARVAVVGASASWRCDVLIERPAELCNIRSIDQTRIQVLHRCVRRRDQPTIGEAFRAGMGGGGGAGGDAGGDDTEYDEVIDEVERLRCWYELHEGAIYLNQGRKFEVVSWEAPRGIIRVRATNARYYTGCLDKLKVHVMQRNQVWPFSEIPRAGTGSSGGGCSSGGSCGSGDGGGDGGEVGSRAGGERSSGQLCCGRVRVTLEVGGFVKRWQKTGEIFEEVPLRMPTYAYDTRACWVDLPEDSTAELAKLGLPMDAGLHAMAHALLSMLPLRLSCDPGDVGCECDALRHRQLWPKRLLLFDKREGGLGIAERAATVLLPLLRDALLLMTECDCKDGCYCCVHSSKCAEYNVGVDKRAAIALTKHVLNAAAAARLPPARGSVQQAAVDPLAPACFACAEEDKAQPVRDEGREDEGEVEEADVAEEVPMPEQQSMFGRSIAIFRGLAGSGTSGGGARLSSDTRRVASGIAARPPPCARL